MGHALFSPEGFPITGILTQGWQCADIDNIDPFGGTPEFSSHDFPEMMAWPTAAPLMNDIDGEDWLLPHCRWVERVKNIRRPQPTSQSDDAIFQVGTLTLKPGYNPGTTWIVQSSGEGGEFPTDKIEAVLQAYYKESF